MRVPEEPNSAPIGGDITIQDFTPDIDGYAGDVSQIVRWSVQGSMVAISPDSIKTHYFPTAAYDQSSGDLVGYGAITHIYSAQVMELGGLVVHKEQRGRGIASAISRKIVAKAFEAMGPELIIAFSNTSSAPIFEKLGGVRIEDARRLPAEVWKVCHTCRYYDDVQASGGGCCGRVYDITNIRTSEE